MSTILKTLSFELINIFVILRLLKCVCVHAEVHIDKLFDTVPLTWWVAFWIGVDFEGFRFWRKNERFTTALKYF